MLDGPKLYHGFSVVNVHYNIFQIFSRAVGSSWLIEGDGLESGTQLISGGLSFDLGDAAKQHLHAAVSPMLC
jgi:hypothetical protein